MEDPKPQVIGLLTMPPYDRMYKQSCRVFNPNGIAPTLLTPVGG